MDEYDLIKVVGKGEFGNVWLGKHIPTEEPCAIKVVKKASVRPEHRNALLREIELLRNLQHPAIIELYAVIETKDKLNIIMEYAGGGELFDKINQTGCLPLSRCKAVARQLMQALSYCHSHKVAHRDIKPENILFCNDDAIKIVDFGLGTIIRSSKKMKTPVGSLHYWAPELVEGHSYHGELVDAWAAGVVLFIMITGHMPFSSEVSSSHYKQMGHDDIIRKKILCDQPDFPPNMDADARDLLNRLLAKDYHYRITPHHALRHPFLRPRSQVMPSTLHASANQAHEQSQMPSLSSSYKGHEVSFHTNHSANRASTPLGLIQENLSLDLPQEDPAAVPYDSSLFATPRDPPPHQSAKRYPAGADSLPPPTILPPATTAQPPLSKDGENNNNSNSNNSSSDIDGTAVAKVVALGYPEDQVLRDLQTNNRSGAYGAYVLFRKHAQRPH